jgi:alkylhydroperoxidase family enzyme
MPLISYVDDAVYQKRLGSPQVANLLRVLFHSPTWAEAFVRLAGAQMSHLNLPALDRELVILRTGHMLDASYVVAQHEGISQLLGVSDAQRSALQDRSFDEAAFSDRQRALLFFVDTLADHTVDNAAELANAKRYFTEPELVEIVGLQGFAATVAAMTRTFQIDVDPVSGQDLLRFSEKIAGS